MRLLENLVRSNRDVREYTVFISLLGVFLFYEYAEHTLNLDTPITDLVFPSMGLAILVLFFLAIV